MNMNIREVKTNILVSLHQPRAKALHENPVKINNVTHSYPLSKHKKCRFKCFQRHLVLPQKNVMKTSSSVV